MACCLEGKKFKSHANEQQLGAGLKELPEHR